MMTLEDIAKRLDRLESVAALNKSVLDINEVAMLTGYAVKYLRTLIARREIPYYRRGNRLFFQRHEVEEWLLQTRIPSTNEMRIKAMQR